MIEVNTYDAVGKFLRKEFFEFEKNTSIFKFFKEKNMFEHNFIHVNNVRISPMYVLHDKDVIQIQYTHFVK